MQVRKVVIPAAGLGTRFLPATKVVPKELFPLVDRPLIHEVVAEAVASGISDLVLVTARGKSAIEDYFDIDPALDGLSILHLSDLHLTRTCSGGSGRYPG